MELALIGTWHMNRRSVARASLDAVGSDAEALAVEYPIIQEYQSWLRAVLGAPLVFLGGSVLGALLQLPLMALIGRDVVSTECSVALADDRPIHFVDRHPMLVVLDRSIAWSVLNWVVCLALIVLWPIATALFVGLALAASVLLGLRFRGGPRRVLAVAAIGLSGVAWWLALTVPGATIVGAVSATLMIVIVFVTVQDRNHRMLTDCLAFAEREGYESVALLTGRAHVPGIVDVLEEYPLTCSGIYFQRFLREGSTATPDEVTDRSTTNLGVSVDERLTEGVLKRRLLAGAIDTAIVGVGTLVVAIGTLVPLTVIHAIGAEWLAIVLSVVAALAIVAVAPTYYVALEYRFGRTLGHRLFGLEVIAVGGGQPSLKQLVLRTLGRVFDVLPVAYALGIAVAYAGDGSRRVGDLRAGTAVVRSGRSTE
ncbi:MAG: RDD family protein [Halococcoides sp.]